MGALTQLDRAESRLTLLRKPGPPGGFFFPLILELVEADTERGGEELVSLTLVTEHDVVHLALVEICKGVFVHALCHRGPRFKDDLEPVAPGSLWKKEEKKKN